MSIEGHLIFYSETRPKDPVRLLRDALRTIQPEKVTGVFRTPGKERSWKARKKLAKIIRQYHKRGEVASISGSTLSELNPLKHVYKSCSLDEAVERAQDLYRAGTCLRLWLGGVEFTREIDSGYQRDVPPDIRDGSMLINSTWLAIGRHDVFGTPEDPDKPVYFGRAFFSLEFSGYGAPTDWIETRRLTFQIPEVQKTKAALERIAGPLQQCMYWSV